MDRASLPPRPLPLMLLLAAAVGVIAGVGAWGFRMLIGLVHNAFFLGQYSWFYDANLHTPAGPWGPYVILAPVIGAVLVAWLVGTFAPEAKGHGVPEVMDAIHYKEGHIRPQVAIVKSLASAISIGSGASVGREGPIVQIGSAFGATLGQVVPMRAADRSVLIAAGAGAGIAATFNAPLGGLVFAIELLLLHVTARSVLLVATATTIATRIGNALLGSAPAFALPALEVPDALLFAPGALALFMLLGSVAGALSVAFIRGIYAAEDLFDAIPGTYTTRHVLGMLLLGGMIWLLMQRTGHYWVQGVGYGTILDTLTGALADPLFLLMLVALKLLATCLSLGSGASGGVFSPALVIGAAAGAAFGHAVEAMLPGLGLGIPVFVLAGMAGMVAGTTGAALTGIIMITEMTDDTSAILPLICAGSAAWAARRAVMEQSIYTMKLIARGHRVPEGLQSPVLATRRVADAMDGGFALAGLPGADDAVAIHAAEGGGIGAVVAPDGRRLRFVTTAAQDGLLATLARMADARAEIAVVLPDPHAGAPGTVVGILGLDAVLRLLRAEHARE